MLQLCILSMENPWKSSLGAEDPWIHSQPPLLEGLEEVVKHRRYRGALVESAVDPSGRGSSQLPVIQWLG